MSETDIFKEDVELTSDSLMQLNKLVKQQQDLQEEIEAITNLLKKKNNELEKIARELIPTLLYSNGLSELKLANGKKIIIEDKIKASIANKNYEKAYLEMKNEDGEIIDELFKSQVVLENSDNELLQYFIDNGIMYEAKKTIHPSTLKKYVREKLESGQRVPDGISVFRYNETTIK